MSSNTTTREITAAVVRGKEQPFVIEQARLRGPQDDEVLVKVVATGLCHTDLIVRDQYYPVPLQSLPRRPWCLLQGLLRTELRWR